MQFIDLQKQYLALKDKIDSRIEKVLSKANFIGGEEVGELSGVLSDLCKRHRRAHACIALF